MTGRQGWWVLLVAGTLIQPAALLADYPWDEMGKAREEREGARRESVLQRAKEFEESARGKTDLERELLFGRFYGFNRAARDRYVHDNNLDSKHWAGMASEREREMAPFLAEVAPVGWTMRLTGKEPAWTLEDDPAWMDRRFGDLLPLSWRDYLRGVYDEGVPAVDRESARRRADFWEAFLARNPEFPFKSEAEGFMKSNREYLQDLGKKAGDGTGKGRAGGLREHP